MASGTTYFRIECVQANDDLSVYPSTLNTIANSAALLVRFAILLLSFFVRGARARAELTENARDDIVILLLTRPERRDALSPPTLTQAKATLMAVGS